MMVLSFVTGSTVIDVSVVVWVVLMIVPLCQVESRVVLFPILAVLTTVVSFLFEVLAVQALSDSTIINTNAGGFKKIFMPVRFIYGT